MVSEMVCFVLVESIWMGGCELSELGLRQYERDQFSVNKMKGPCQDVERPISNRLCFGEEATERKIHTQT